MHLLMCDKLSVFISDKPRSLAQKREPLGTVNSLTGFPEKYKKIGFVSGISEVAFFFFLAWTQMNTFQQISLVLQLCPSVNFWDL